METYQHRTVCLTGTSGTNRSGDSNMSWEVSVDETKLSPDEMLIHQKHRTAVKLGLDMYIDPKTGASVMTRLVHTRRGDCCGNECRHCPYGHKNVQGHKTKKFNTAFYV
ncbi:hypothetical protein ScPMuIL_011126 [Solemya velum]